MKLNLVDQLTLLALDDEKGSFVADSMSFGYGLAGAVILELSLQEMIEVHEKKLRLTSDQSCKDELLDYFLEIIRKEKKEKDIQEWVEVIGAEETYIKENTVEKLIGAGILLKKEEKFLWVFSNDKYPTQNVKPENELRKALIDILTDQREVNLHDMMLFSLIDMCELNTEVFGKEKAKKYENKIKNIVESEQLSSSLTQAIKEIHEVLMSVIFMLISTTIINN
nr:GPP34 family phosphoprotein [uncultured Marinifilum sp.]